MENIKCAKDKMIVENFESILARCKMEADNDSELAKMMYAETCAYFELMEKHKWYKIIMWEKPITVAGGYNLVGEAYATKEDFEEEHYGAVLRIDSTIIDGKYVVSYTPLYSYF